MDWLFGISIALLLTTALGAHVLAQQPQVWLRYAWLVSMLGATGWYTFGAYQLSERLHRLGDGLAQLAPRASRVTTMPAPAEAPTASQTPPETPTPDPVPSPPLPMRWDQFPAQTGTPVEIEVSSVSPARFVGIDMRVRLSNLDATRTVDGVRFDIWCYDNFGDLQHEPGSFGRTSFGMVDQQRIQPRERVSGTWSIRHGANNCTRARAWVRSVHFTDGTQWEGEPTPVAG